MTFIHSNRVFHLHPIHVLCLYLLALNCCVSSMTSPCLLPTHPYPPSMTSSHLLPTHPHPQGRRPLPLAAWSKTCVSAELCGISRGRGGVLGETTLMCMLKSITYRALQSGCTFYLLPAELQVTGFLYSDQHKTLFSFQILVKEGETDILF